MDYETSEALIGCNVLLEGTSIGAASDIDGHYNISSVPVGRYNIIFSSIGYTKSKIENVEILSSSTTIVNYSLKTESFKTDEVVVQAKAETAFEAALLNQRKLASTISDGISAEQIKKSPDATRKAGSVALTGASFTNYRLLDSFFTPTTFVGALDANEKWDLGWTNYDPQNTDYKITDVEEKLIGSIPIDFSLSQNYPNPFNPSTKISFSIPEASNVKISVFNLLGEEVDILFDGFKNAGVYEINWTAKDLSSGIYFYKLQTNSINLTKKMSLLK